MISKDHCIPTINVIDENQQVVTQIQPQTPGRPTATATPVTSDIAAWMEESAKVMLRN